MLSGIRLFDVSQNSISGSIPTELTDVSALQVRSRSEIMGRSWGDGGRGDAEVGR